MEDTARKNVALDKDAYERLKEAKEKCREMGFSYPTFSDGVRLIAGHKFGGRKDGRHR